MSYYAKDKEKHWVLLSLFWRRLQWADVWVRMKSVDLCLEQGNYNWMGGKDGTWKLFLAAMMRIYFFQVPMLWQMTGACKYWRELKPRIMYHFGDRKKVVFIVGIRYVQTSTIISVPEMVPLPQVLRIRSKDSLRIRISDCKSAWYYLLQFLVTRYSSRGKNTCYFLSNDNLGF